ncbi:MAG TPA: hypothetical protein VN914_02775 [Polyangia bacterium]|nr:hypothetical protein [Polyangia bacterium]
MKDVRPRSCLALLLLAACQAQGPDLDSSDTGRIEVALTAAPADAACLKLTVAGSRTVTKSVGLTAGQSTVFSQDKLPIGIATVDGAAYGTACAAVTPASTPLYASEAPVSVRIEPVAVVKVILKLVRNGQIQVSVDFELPPWVSDSKAPFDLAVFGDTPYGATQIADVPNFIASLDKDPTIVESVHLGDIKNGSSRCDDSYFKFVFDSFSALKKPFLYTPGDNEWTDCHRANNGAYNPLERLAAIRTLFYPLPGQSLGQAKRQVLTQASFAGFETFVENQLWVEGAATFAMVHVVGSNNSLLPWFTDDTTGTKMDDPAARTGEEQARNAANLAWLDRAFATAKLYGSAAVVLMMQADMWDAGPSDGFNDTVQRIAALALASGKPVLLLQGDSHVFKVDNPLASGDAVHGVSTPVPNLTRIVVQGSTTAPLSEWVKLHIDAAASPPFSWTRVTH